MNFNVVRAVWKRDLRSWFGNPASYAFIILFVIGSQVALMWSPGFFANNLANLDTLNAWFPALAVAFVSAATMNCWTSERATGTQELLFTLPGRDADLQLGKFLAAASSYTVSLAFTLVLPIALGMLGSPDWGQLFANYVGYWLLGVMLVSVAMVGSQLTQNATVSIGFSGVLCALVVYLGDLLGWIGATRLQQVGPIGQFRLFADGEIPFSGVLLFLGLTVAFFYLGLALLARRHWRRADQGLHSALRFVGISVSACALTVIGVQALPRIDTTVEGIHSLSDETRKLIASLDPDRPVIITAFVSEEVPEPYVQQRKLLLGLIDQFDSLGGGVISKHVVMPEPYSKEARQAEANFDIRPQRAMISRPGGGSVEMQMFLGFAVQSGTEKVVTPFVGPSLPIEYELMRSVRTVANVDRLKVGVLKTDVELAGGFDMQTFRQKPEWAIAHELKLQYELVNVDAASDYPADIACLVVPQPSSLEQEPMDRLQQWILDGHATLLFEDPFPYDPGAQGTAADDPKGGMQARMMGGGGPEKGNWAGFQNAIGIRAPVGELAWDLSYRTIPGMPYPEFLFVRQKGASNDSVITAGLQNLVLLFAGHVQAAGGDGLSFVPLLQSEQPSMAGDEFSAGTVRKSDLFRQSLFGMQHNPNARRKPSASALTLAALVRGKPMPSSEKDVNFIYVADLDMISSQFFQMRAQMDNAAFQFDNVTFALNCIDVLAGDESLIPVRKRRPVLRKLDSVEEAQEEFEKAWQRKRDEAEAAAEKSLEKAKERLKEAVDKIRDDATLDEQAKQVKVREVESLENRKLEIETAQIEDDKNRKIEEAQHDRDVARIGIHDRYRMITLVLSIVPGLLVGLFVLFRRASRASAIVPQSRRVGSHGGN